MPKICLRFLIIYFCYNFIYGQDSLTLSSGNGTSGSVTLALWLNSPAGNEPSALEWVLSYPSANVVSAAATAGSPLTAAGKTLTCYQDPVAGALTCVAAGTNTNIILNGAVASVTFTMAGGAPTTAVAVTAMASDSAGGALSVSGNGATITGSGGAGTGSGTSGSPPGPAVSAIACSPTSIVAGQQTVCTVALSGPAPNGGFVVSLSSVANGALLSLPASLTIPAGASSATFNATGLTTSTGQTVIINATSNGVGAATAITVSPAATLSLACSPASVTAGFSSACTVTLPSATPSGGAVVTLSSSAPAAITPSSLSISPGASSGTFTVSTSKVTSNVMATITATYSGSSATSSIAIQPFVISAIACSPAIVVGSTPSTCTIALAGPAPPGGANVVISDNSSVTSEPATVTAPAGASSASFTVSTTAVASSQVVTLTAALGGVTQTATVTVDPAVPLSSLSCALPTVGGTQMMANSSATTCTVSLTKAANALQTISLASSSAALIVPASISIPAGAASASFTANSGKLSANSQAVAITAATPGSSATLRFTLSVQVSKIACTPNAIASPNATAISTCTVSLSQNTAAALTVAIANSSATSLSTPASVSIPAGAASVTFAATAQQVPFAAVSLTASFNGIAQSTAVNVGWPPPSSVACTPSVLAALSTAVCTVTMKGPTPAGGSRIVDLRSSSSLLSLPKTITLAAGVTSGSFTVTALAGFSGPVTVSAIAAGTASFTISYRTSSSGAEPKPLSGASGPISSLRCSPRSLQAGGASLCQIQLNGPSSQAREVQLSVSSPSILIPAKVAARPNQSQLSFQAIADPAAPSGTVAVQASSGGQVVEEFLGVNAEAKPVMTAPSRQGVKVGSKLSFDVAASSSLEAPVLRASFLPEGASFDPMRGRFEWTPTRSQQGHWDVVFSATNTSGESTSVKVPIEAGSGAPLLRRVVHAAAGAFQSAACSPGSLASAEGEWLSEAVASAPTGPVTSLGGARMIVNGRYAPLVYSSPQKIVFVCPAGLGDTLTASVETEAGRSASVQARAADSVPGIFTVDGSGEGQD